MLATLDIGSIEVGTRLRGAKPEQVAALAESIADVGLMNPIAVYRLRRFNGGGYEEAYGLIAGLHRLEACRALGLAEIDANIMEIGDLERQIAECDENLCGPVLSPSERARFTRRRKEAYEALHPDSRHGGDRKSDQVDKLSTRSFADDQAARTGVDPRSVRRDFLRAERIRDEALDAITGTDLDTGVFLDELKQLDPDEQLGHVRHRLNGARAIAARRQEPADSLDYFPTPPWATRALMEIVLPLLGLSPDALAVASRTALRDLGISMRLWEPACGEGHMSGVLCEYSDDVVATDIAGYGSAEGSPPGWSGRHDFLDPAYAGPIPPADWIITNPPFGDLSLAFARRALGLAQVGVALFVRQQWLEGVGRYGELFSKHPPALVAQFAERVNLKKGEWDPDGDTLTSYIWVVWVKAPGVTLQNGDTRLMWIPPGQREALKRPDDVERFTAHPVRVPAASADTSLQNLQTTPRHDTNLPTGEWSADEARAANAGATGEDFAAAASPVTGISLTSVEIDQLIVDGYAAGGADLVRRLAEATGLSREAVRKRASRMEITSDENQREAASRAAIALNASRADGSPERLAKPERGAEGATDAES